VPPLRLGQFFKSNPPDGPLDLFHNTILVKDQTITSSFSHFRDAPPAPGAAPNCRLTRRSFNNVFVAVNTIPEAELPISWLPNPTGPSATAGNCYFRIGGFTGGDLLRHFEYEFPGEDDPVPGTGFLTLDELRGGDPPPPPPSTIFRHSRAVHPLVMRFSASLRTHSFSISIPCRTAHPATTSASDGTVLPAAMVCLPDELRCLDGAPPSESPDIGCFRLGDMPLTVGVDGRKQSPTYEPISSLRRTYASCRDFR
jgi:hypothetical protein